MMKNEVSRTSGDQIWENILRDEVEVDSCIRNVSVQTGEEFSPHFLQNLTNRRKMQTQQYQHDSVTLGTTIQTAIDSPQSFHATPTRIPTGLHFNQNEKLVYEYQTDSRSDFRGLQMESEQTGYYQKDYNNNNAIRGHHHNQPQRSPTYTNETRMHKFKMKFLCSFGGKFLTRPSDGKLRYVGGETRIISIKKNLEYKELVKKTYTICKQPHVIKYQLPGEDLDALISVCSDEDFLHMIDEYQELEKGSHRLRIFLESSNERESSSSSDNSYKYTVVVPSPHKRSTDSITSFEKESPSSNSCSNSAIKLPNSNQLMKSPSFQCRDATNCQPKVGRDRMEQQQQQTAYESQNPFLDSNITSGTYQRIESQQNDHITLCQKQSRRQRHNYNHNYNNNYNYNYNYNHPVICKQYSECDQDIIKWKENNNNNNNLNLVFDSDIEEYHYNLSPATPLERQISMATTISSDGLHHNTSLETNNKVNLVVPNSTVCASVNSEISYGGSIRSQNSEDVIDSLPFDILLSTKELLCIHTKNQSVSRSQSNSKDAEDDKRMRDGPISDTTMAEIQAGMHGLQTIKNIDLEELQELGCGTFGTVYHGKWRGTDVAIKRIKDSCFSGKPSEKERSTKDFWREAQILSQLHHPNVVALYGVVRDGPGGTLSTVTEFMAHGSLRHVLSKRNKELDHRKRLIIAQDAAMGMEYLHLKNIVHFDLKCDNLLVNMGDPDRPVCKVGDFGLSRMKRNSLVSGGARGTLPWIAPELLDGSSTRVSEKVDVFSFGIAMWEILTGEEPYADMHCGAIIGGIVTNTLRPSIPRQCDNGWRVLMEECWSNDPADRPSFTQITNKLQAMSLALQSKSQKRAAR
ncbi:hypothetical protein LXL04_014583 [Taraxacum kok-saghyz]